MLRKHRQRSPFKDEYGIADYEHWFTQTEKYCFPCTKQHVVHMVVCAYTCQSPFDDKSLRSLLQTGQLFGVSATTIKSIVRGAGVLLRKWGGSRKGERFGNRKASEKVMFTEFAKTSKTGLRLHEYVLQLFHKNKTYSEIQKILRYKHHVDISIATIKRIIAGQRQY